jgi:hypothetical protein
MGRRNLTSRSDLEQEVALVAPEAEIVKVMTYEERFGTDSRGVFIVAGGEDGSELSTPTQSLILTSLRDRVPLDVNVYLSSPSILPVESVTSISWNPQETTTFTDTLAGQIQSVLVDYINPVQTEIGNNLSVSAVLREILDLPFVQEVRTLDLKEMLLDSSITGPTDGICGRFLGTESDDGTVCNYSYSQIVTKNSTEPLVVANSTSGFKLYRSIVSLVSIVDYSVLTYTYDNLYNVV